MTHADRFAVLAALVVAVQHASASDGIDSTKMKAPTALTPSACKNTDQWYASVPSGWYRDNSTGYCSPIPTCPYGWNATSQTCNAAPPPPAPSPAPTPAPTPAPVPAPPTPVPPTVTLSIPSAAYAESTMAVSWSASGQPLPTGTTVTCYSASSGTALVSWVLTGTAGSASVATSDGMVGSDKCSAFVSTGAGNTTSDYSPLTGICPPAMPFFDSVTGTCTVQSPPGLLSSPGIATSYLYTTSQAGVTG